MDKQDLDGTIISVKIVTAKELRKMEEEQAELDNEGS